MHNADLVVNKYVVTTEFEPLISFVSVVINTLYPYNLMTHIEHFGSYLHLWHFSSFRPVIINF